MTKVKYTKGQFDEVVFERDGQEHTVFIIEGLVYTMTRELFTWKNTWTHNAKVKEGKNDFGFNAKTETFESL